MKRFSLLLLFSIAVALSACNFAYAQSSRTNRIFRPCPSTTTPASVSISTAGAITLSPCSGQTVSLPAGTTFGGTAPTAGSVLFAGSSGEIQQDNANFFWNDTSNYLVVGHTTRFNSIADIEINKETRATFGLTSFSTSLNPGIEGSRYRGTRSVPLTVQADDSLLSIGGRGYNGTALTNNRAVIAFKAAEIFSDTNNGTYVELWVTPLASTTLQSRARLYSTGFQIGSDLQFGWGTTTTAPATRDTGFARQSAGVIRATDGSTAVRGLIGGGAAVASAAALPLPTGRVFHVTGTTNITSITSTDFAAGVCITLIFDDVLTFTDGNNLAIAGNFVTTANDTISLCYDGTNWFETGRSVN